MYLIMETIKLYKNKVVKDIFYLGNSTLLLPLSNTYICSTITYKFNILTVLLYLHMAHIGYHS